MGYIKLHKNEVCKFARYNQNVLDVNNKEYNYQTGDHYMDIISECEKLGDYVVNVVEARTDIKEKKI